MCVCVRAGFLLLFLFPLLLSPLLLVALALCLLCSLDLPGLKACEEGFGAFFFLLAHSLFLFGFECVTFVHACACLCVLAQGF